MFRNGLYIGCMLALPLALVGCCENNTSPSFPADAGSDSNISDGGTTPDATTTDTSTNDASMDPTLLCDGLAIEGTVDASLWVQNQTQVQRYRYTGAFDKNELQVEALGPDDAPLLTLRTRQILNNGDEGLPEGVMVTDFDAGNLGNGTLWTSAQTTLEGYAIATRMQVGEEELRTEARFALTQCAPDTEEDRPSCTWPLELGTSGVTMHDCGLPAWETEQTRRPKLIELTYVAATSAEGGPELRRDGPNHVSIVTVFDGQELASEDTIQTWASASGADTLLGSALEKLVSTVHLDAAWRTRTQLHAEHCQRRDAEAQNTTTQGLTIRRQPLSPSGLGNRNRKSQLASGIKDLEKKVSDNAPGKEIKICLAGCGKGFGDPHMRSFDGLGYDFHSAGEFVFVRSDDNSMLVQARMSPPEGNAEPRCRAVTLIERIAFRFQNERWEVQLRGGLQIFRDGEPFDPTQPLDEGWSVAIRSYKAFFTWPEGMQLMAAGSNVQITLPESMQGRVEGLLGRFDGSYALYDAQGRAYPQPITFEDLYQNYGESWRINTDTSLFSYTDGQGPEDFHDRASPPFVITLKDFTPEELAQPLEICTAMDITDPALLDACVLDTYCAGSTVGNEAANTVSAAANASPGQPLVIGAGRYTTAPERLPLTSPRTQPRTSNLCPEDTEPLALIFEEGLWTLDDDLEVDIRDVGTWEQPQTPAPTLAAETELRAYAVVLIESDDLAPRQVRIVFDEPIAGILTQGDGLKRSDPFINSNLEWPEASKRGLEPLRDAVTIEEDRKTVTLRMDGLNNLDALRILTEVTQ